MTGEGVKDTEKWVSDLGMKYAFAYERSGKLMGELGCSGYPSAALVDPTGTVVWVGHPASLSEKQIQAALEGALPKAVYEWPASAAAAAQALRKKKYADAIAAAAKVPEADGGPAIHAALLKVVDGRVKTIEVARQKGDFLTAAESAKALSKELAGLAQAAVADQHADEIAKDALAQKIIKAQKRVRELRAEKLGKKNEREKAIEDLEKIIKNFPDTFVASEAQALLGSLRKTK